MKILIILIINIIIIQTGNSQILEIYEEAKDAINAAEMEIIVGLEKVSNAEQEKELETNSKKTGVLKEQKKNLEEIKKLSEEISEGFKKYSTIKEVLKVLTKTINLYVRLSKTVENLKDSKGNNKYTKQEIISINVTLFKYVKAQKDIIKDIKLILNENQSKMSEEEGLAAFICGRTKNEKEPLRII